MGFTGVECFPEIIEITALSVQAVKWVSGINFGKLWIWGSAMCACVQSICSATAAMSWRHDALQGQNPQQTRVFQLAVERKRKAHSVEVCQGNWKRVFLWHQKVPLFQHAPILLHVRGLLGDCYFCIYLFYLFCLFVCFFLVIFYSLI